jgi:hypothetical protein
MTLVILLVLAVSLFALAFFTRRRFGGLGLGLTAGLVLSEQLNKDVAQIMRVGDFPVEPLTYRSAAIIFLILAPALVMLFAGPKYNDKRAAVFGGIAFAIFGTILLLAPLSTSLPLNDPAIRPTLSAIALHSPTIIAAGIIAAVFDTMHAHGKNVLGKKARH